jgi:hypothetical protein
MRKKGGKNQLQKGTARIFYKTQEIFSSKKLLKPDDSAFRIRLLKFNFLKVKNIR